MIFRNVQGHEVTLPPGKTVAWRISAYAVIERDGKILMVIPTWHDVHELPGGEINLDENILTGLKREVLEETGYHIEPDLQPVYVAEEYFYHHWTQTFYHSLLLIYRATLTDDIQDAFMVSVDEIKGIYWRSMLELNQENAHYIFWKVLNQIGGINAKPKDCTYHAP